MIKKSGKKSCVVTKTGKKIKCYSSKKKAKKMDAAIVISKMKRKKK